MNMQLWFSNEVGVIRDFKKWKKRNITIARIGRSFKCTKNEAENLAKKLFPMTSLKYQLKERLRKFFMWNDGRKWSCGKY